MTDIQKENKSGGKVPNNPKQIPNLRFPNFSEPWKSIRLADICEINPKNESLPSSFIYIDLESVANGQLLKEDFISKNEAPSRAQRVLSKNDILFQMVRPYQKNNLFFDKEGKYVASTGYAQLRTKQNSQFVFQYLHNQRFVDNVIERCTGTSYPAINSTDLGNIQIYYPCLEEQTKIASFLSKIDEHIQTQNKIINDLKTLKTTLSKKIFSQELRFKDDKGNEFLEWENILLGDTLDYEQPTNYLVSSTEYDDSFEIPVVTAGKTFILGYTDEKKGVFEKEKLPVIIFDDFTTASQFVDFPFKAKSSAMKILKAKNDTNIRFIFEALQMINYEVGGHGRHWISVFSNLSISVPSLPEQTKIANFLSSIDLKIDIENQLLQKLEEQKKFLLQNMFV